VEENLRACGRIRGQYHLNSKRKVVFSSCPYEGKVMDDFVFEACINERPCIDRSHVYEQLGATITTVPKIYIFNNYFPDKITDLKVDHRYERQPIFE